MGTPPFPVTPDGRYLVVRGRLWRMSSPHLSAEEHERAVRELMRARAALGRAQKAKDATKRRAARERIDAAKVALGERGAVWWDDGAPDYNRVLVANSPYRAWHEALSLAGAAGPRRRRR